MSWKDGKAKLRFSPSDDSVLEEVSKTFCLGCSLCAKAVVHDECRLTKHASPENVERAKGMLRSLVVGKPVLARASKAPPWFPTPQALLDLLREYGGSAREVAKAVGVSERVVQRRVSALRARAS